MPSFGGPGPPICCPLWCHPAVVFVQNQVGHARWTATVEDVGMDVCYTMKWPVGLGGLVDLVGAVHGLATQLVAPLLDPLEVLGGRCL